MNPNILSPIRRLLLVLAVGVFTSSSALASATIMIEIDPADVGFNDPTPVAPVGGNNGTTIGEQRLIAFHFAADIWGATLNSGPTITIRAKWVALPCTSTSVILGSAGTTTIHSNFPNAGFPNTWYSAALANALSGADRNGVQAEISAQFNVSIGSGNCLPDSPWYYGLDGGHGGGIDLVAVLLHEFSHGLGFQAFTDLATGAQTGPNGAAGIFDRFLRDNTSGKLWTEMTDAERAASAVNNGNLVWAGSQVTAQTANVLGTPRLTIISPAAIAGNYNVGTADFGPSLPSPGVTGSVVRALDPSDSAGPSTTDGCSAFTNAASISGKIAFIDRGTCNFIDKVKNAQAAGATAAIIGNVFNSQNSGSTQIMGAAGPPALILIPSVQLAFSNAESIRNQLGSSVTGSVLIDHSVLLGADSSNRVKMHAPSSLSDGSSVSHFDISAYANLLMEPNNDGDISHSVNPPQDLTFSLFRDLGWTGASSGGTPPSVQFNSASVSANENVGSMSVIVTRTGDTSGISTVNYATSDTAGTNACSQITGAASSRCDYLRTLGTLTFAAGETSKTILVPIVDDAYSEGSETFTITLSNVTGATLGTATATLTINDGGPEGGGNPIDGTSFFVRQHYIDFLNREPDAAGLNFWINDINSCGGNAQCIEVHRINVSAAFFLSIEFQNTGYLVYRIYKSAFDNLPGKPVPIVLNDFLRDTQRIGQGVQVNVGNWEAQLEANKQAYTLAFVQRADFLDAYNNLSAQDFVAKLNMNAGNVLSPGEQTTLINILQADPTDVTKRSQVLRAVAEDADLKTAEFNRAFVLMQYFGYLRRNPNDFPEPGLNFDGFNFWLNKLNTVGNFVNAEMVKSFLQSSEYRNRFGL